MQSLVFKLLLIQQVFRSIWYIYK